MHFTKFFIERRGNGDSLVFLIEIEIHFNNPFFKVLTLGQKVDNSDVVRVTFAFTQKFFVG